LISVWRPNSSSARAAMAQVSISLDLSSGERDRKD